RARERGALGIGLSCNADTPLSAVAEHGIEVEVGPEVLSGSTRLKSGTAQKLVLNMFSTISMVRGGKAYGNLMVDVKATNHKLRERAIRMVRTIAEVDRDTAVAALETAAWDVKLASIMIRRGEDLAAATTRLTAAGGRLRTVLEEN
uniref:N-acetylmuramic acid 6-phosphate etherase n=1 Tax=Microbacterium sp. K41 TaxID=2305437 RepID=UPI00109D42BB